MTLLSQTNRQDLEAYLDEQTGKLTYEGLTLDSRDVLARTEKFLSGEIHIGRPARCQINKMGSDKKRTIYIFLPEDQLVLKAVNYCLSRSDLGLLPCCLAFRPGYCVHRAYRIITGKYKEEYSCIRLDITNYFNSIPTESLINMLEKRLVSYPEEVRALSDLLKDPYVIDDDRIVEDPNKGAMAGMLLAPLLANLYLSDFDRQASAWAPVYGRYSDDLIFFCPPGDVSATYDTIRRAIEAHGLLLNDSKTKIVPPGEKWEFLGLSYNRGEIDLSDATIMKIKGKISRAARKLYRWKYKKNASTERAVRALIRKFQYKFYGSGKDDDELTWSRWYFPLITKTEGLKTVDQYFQVWARYLDVGRHRKISYRNVTYSMLRDYGYVPLVSAYHKRERDPAQKRAAAKETALLSSKRLPARNRTGPARAGKIHRGSFSRPSLNFRHSGIQSGYQLTEEREVKVCSREQYGK